MARLAVGISSPKERSNMGFLHYWRAIKTQLDEEFVHLIPEFFENLSAQEVEAIHGILKDGKRVRGCLVSLMSHALGGKIEDAIPRAMAIECIQAASLIHDDYVDGDTVRRSFAIGIYYMVFYTPLLWAIAIPEGFFLFAYNREWFKGRFHTDGWFAFSWGILPVLAGYVLQTNRVSLPVIIVAASMGLLSLVEIKASRPYKQMKRASIEHGHDIDRAQIQRFESILKSISLGVILLGTGLLSIRWLG